MTYFYHRLLNRIRERFLDLRFSGRSPALKTQTLLLLRLDSIGDYILFRDFIRVLRTSDTYKHYHITLCGNLWWKDLAETLDAGAVDRFIWVDYRKMQGFNYRRRIIGQIYRSGFETLIHPTYSRDELSDQLVRYSGAAERIGYAGDEVNLGSARKGWYERYYTRLIPSSGEFMFEYFRNHHFFQQLLSRKLPVERPVIATEQAEEKRVVICPGAKDAFRRWSPRHFAALCDRLQAGDPQLRFTICGSDADRPFAREIMAHSKIRYDDQTGILSLTGLLDLLSRAELVLTNDSGPFHIAVALNKKVLCISNGNNYGRFSPYPAALKTRSRVVYPPVLEAITSERERLERFCKHGSDLDINLIEPDRVYRILKTEGM